MVEYKCKKDKEQVLKTRKATIMTKITNAIALSIAIENLSNISTLNDAQGLNQISDEEKIAVIERLTAMFDSIVKRAEKSKERDRKPTPKEIKAQEENAKLIDATYTEMNKRPDFLYECKMLADTMEVSTPKMAHVLAFLVNCGKVKRIEGKKPNFQIVKGE